MESIKKDAVRGIYISPSVDFDAETGICEIKGESFFEETAKFYAPLLAWIKDYMKTGKPITFNIKLTYFNTSTSKWILNILHALREYQENGHKVTVNWYYLKDDFDMIEEIEDYQSDAGISINKIEINDEKFFS